MLYVGNSSYTEGSMYSVFDIEEGGVVWCTCFIEYFKVAAV